MLSEWWDCLSGYYRWPFEVLYWHGPTLGGYGFWGGMKPADVCAMNTGVPSSHWFSNHGTCVDLSERYFTAFFVAMHALGVSSVLMYLVVRCCCCHPLAQFCLSLVREVAQMRYQHAI